VAERMGWEGNSVGCLLSGDFSFNFLLYCPLMWFIYFILPHPCLLLFSTFEELLLLYPAGVSVLDLVFWYCTSVTVFSFVHGQKFPFLAYACLRFWKEFMMGYDLLRLLCSCYYCSYWYCTVQCYQPYVPG